MGRQTKIDLDQMTYISLAVLRSEVPRVEQDDLGGLDGLIEHREGLTRMRSPPKLA